MQEIIHSTVISSKEVISELISHDIEGLSYSKPIFIDNSSSVLDSPLNPDDIIKGLELIKIIFETSTAIATFGVVLSEILNKNKTQAEINKNKIDENTSKDSISDLIK